MLILITLLATGCKNGDLIDFPSQKAFEVKTTQLIDYDAHIATILVSGDVSLENAPDLSRLKFYSNPRCLEPSVGQGLVETFESQGLQLKLPVLSESEIFVSTDTTELCFQLFKYKPEVNIVPSPTFIRTAPASPSREIWTPGIYGTAFPSASTINFYTDSDCSLEIVGTGTASEFATKGIQLQLSQNATKSIFARVTDPLDTHSNCTSLTNYQHTEFEAPAPQFDTTEPRSPSKSSLSPKIKGFSDSSLEQIILYSDSACTFSIGSGTAQEFSETGITAVVGEDQSTSIYARGKDRDNHPSACVLLTVFVNDTTAPIPPSYISASPPSPTRWTTLPRIQGSASDDTLTLKLFDSPQCLKAIGYGPKTEFQSVGITANLSANETTSIYGRALDAAGNESSCVLLTSYRHNTIPPGPPLLTMTDPFSPTNKTITPKILGVPSDRTVLVSLFRDDLCSTLIGSGSETDFADPGIIISASPNSETPIYGTATDEEGNSSECVALGIFAHSDIPAPNPQFLLAAPPSPSRATTRPYIVGTTHKSIVTVNLYANSACTDLLGSGSRATFTTAGVQVNLPQNSSTDIYAQSVDVYGNPSPCDVLTTYIHTTLPPYPPVFETIAPASPSNVTSTPVLFGSTYQNPASPLSTAQIAFFDNESCISRLGEGTAAEFASSGIMIGVPENAPSTIYAKAYDLAGNPSACTFMTNFTHNNLKPGRPVYANVYPASPSYTPSTSVSGYFSVSQDFMQIVNVGFYSDAGCTDLIGNGSPTTFTEQGARIDLPENATTSIYAASFNEMGTMSSCAFMTSFKHYDTPPANLRASIRLDGSIQISWTPDMQASPSPTYLVKRSMRADGPYSLIASGSGSPTFTDYDINDGVTYYYRVQATNSTGFSRESTQTSVAVVSPSPVPVATLAATPGSGEVNLTWSGFTQNMIYAVYRSTQPGGPYTVVASSVSSSPYADASVTDGVTYYYVVTGVNPAGESISSNEVGVTPLPVPEPPVAIWIIPEFSAPECGGTSAVSVNWTPTSYNSGYELTRVRDGAFDDLGITGLTRYVDCVSSLTSNTEFYFNVSARWGSARSMTISSAKFFMLGTAGVTLRPGDGHIVLSIVPPNSNATGFDIFRATSPQGPFTKIASDLSSMNYTDASLTNGISYYYYVQGRDNADFIGFPSGTANASPAASPGDPSNLTLSMDSTGSLPTLYWTPPTHFNDFVVQSSLSPTGPFTSHSPTANFPLLAPTLTVDGLYYFRVVARWGSYTSNPTNTVQFRRASIVGFTTASTSSAINLGWSAYSGANEYRIERSPAKTGPFSTIAITNSASYSDTNVSPGEGFYYYVTPRFADGTEGQRSILQSGVRSGSNAPSGLSIITRTSSLISVGWTRVNSATKYNVYRSTDAEGTFALIGSVTSAILQYNHSALAARTTYYFKIGAIVSGKEYLSQIFSGGTFPDPSPPSAEAGNNRLNVTWLPSPGATSYSLERSSDRNSFVTITTGLTSTAFTDSNVSNGEIYFYRLTVVYNTETLTSLPSAGYSPGVQPIAPGQVSVLDNSSEISVTLGWSSVPGANRYTVYMSQSNGGPFTTPLQTVSTNSVIASGLEVDKTYYFVVTAINGEIESAQSAQIGVRTGMLNPAPAVTFATPSSFTIGWTPLTGAISYDLYRSEDSRIFTPLASGLTTNTFIDTTITPNRTYYYRYQPIASNNVFMPLSNTSEAASLAATPNTPLGFQLVADSLSSVLIKWIATPLATSYEIYRSNLSGTDFSLISTVNTPNTTFIDSTVSSGQTYYYTLRSINSSGVPSQLSPEKSITLVNSPSNLTATNSQNLIQLNWDSIGGADSYHIYRSDKSGGPYGLIGNPSSNSFMDLYAIPGNTYFYTVSAVFANSIQSPQSAEVSVAKSGFVDIQHAVEVIDRGIASTSTEARIFERSKTSFNSNDYDGAVTFELEVVATNQDSENKDVDLIDGGGVTWPGLTVPANTLTPTRLRTTVDLPTGAQILRVRLAQTTNDADLTIFSARIWITQIDATRTRIYYPLGASSETPSSLDKGASLSSTSSRNFVVTPASMTFRRQATKLSQLTKINAWELEVLVAQEGGAAGSFAWLNSNTNQYVNTTLTEFSSDSIEMANVPIDDGTNQFGSANEGHLYEVSLRCDLNCDSGNHVDIYKMGAWVRLENLTKAQLITRSALGSTNIVNNNTWVDHRTLIDLASLYNPLVRFQASLTNSGSAGTQVMLSASSTDSGNSDLSIILGSELPFFSISGRETTLSAPIALLTGQRLLTSVQVGPNASVKFHGASLIIDINP